MAEKPLLELQDVNYSPTQNPLLQGIHFTLNRGDRVALLGKSGSGKSLLLRLIAGIIAPDKGRIIRRAASQTLKTEKVEFSPPDADCGLVFQEGALLDDLTVWENIMLPKLELSNLSETTCRQQAVILAGRVGLQEEDLDKFPYQLSGGMRKKVAIARAILPEPSLLLYDEPTAGLDPGASRAIEDLILQIALASGNATLMVTHDLTSLARLNTEILFLHEGRIAFRGAYEEFIRSQAPEIQYFLGK